MPPSIVRFAVTASVLLASVLLHLGMLGMIVLAERRGATTAETEAIEVELVKAPDVPEQLKADSIKPEPPKPEPQKAEPPKPEPQKQVEQTAKPEPQKQTEQPPKPEPPPPPPAAAKPAEQPPAKSAAQSPPEAPPAAPEKPAAPAGPSGGPGDGKTKLTPEEIAALRAQIQKCWTLPVGLPDAMKLEAILRVRLQRNGALTASPELLKANASAGGPVLVGIAMKAVRECAPYRSLPAAKYAEWKVLDLRFLATGMAGTGSARPPAPPRPAG